MKIGSFTVLYILDIFWNYILVLTLYWLFKSLHLAPQQASRYGF